MENGTLGTSNKSKLFDAVGKDIILQLQRKQKAMKPDEPKCNNIMIQQKDFSSIKTFLNKFKDKEMTVLNAIISGQGIAKHELEELIELLPTELELNTMREQQQNLELSGLLEQFLMKLSEIPNYESKIKFMLEREKYRIKFESFTEKLNSIIKGCQLLKEETNITFFLSFITYTAKNIIPDIGNGNIKLEDIPNLLDGKPTEDDAPTYFHAAVDVAQLRDSHFLDFTKKAKRLRKLSKFSLKGIESKLHLLCVSVGTLEKEICHNEVDLSYFHDLVGYVLENTNQITEKIDIANDAAKIIAELYLQDVATFQINQCFKVLSNLFEKIERVSIENSLRDGNYDICTSSYDKTLNATKDKLQCYKELNSENKIIEKKIKSAAVRKNTKKYVNKFQSPYMTDQYIRK